MIDDKPYFYPVVITDVYDGDTVTADFNIGMGVWMLNQKCRLFGINAPELRDAGGPEAKSFLKTMLFGKGVIAETAKDKRDKYGRWLVTLHTADGVVNDRMIEAGYAVVLAYHFTLVEGDVEMARGEVGRFQNVNPQNVGSVSGSDPVKVQTAAEAGSAELRPMATTQVEPSEAQVVGELKRVALNLESSNQSAAREAARRIRNMLEGSPDPVFETT